MQRLMLRLLSWARSQQLVQQVLLLIMHQDAEYICQLLVVLLQSALAGLAARQWKRASAVSHRVSHLS
jgi:hypothetical protein